MKNNNLIFLSKEFYLGLICIALFQNSMAQSEEFNNPKFGLGVALFNVTEYEYDNDYDASSSIYLTFNLGEKYRIEPNFGFAFSKGYERSSLGIGFFRKRSMSNFTLLHGLRLSSYSNKNRVIAPTIGCEYHFIKNFSLGAEIQIKGIVNEGNWAVITNSSVLLRFYFNKKKIRLFIIT